MIISSFVGFGFSDPGLAYPKIGGDSLVFIPGSTSQGDVWPSTWSQQNRDQNAQGGLYSKGDSFSDAGDFGWANGGMDIGRDSYYPAQSGDEGTFDKLLPSTDEDLDEEPVLSDVSDLDQVYNFNSRSNYQRHRNVFRLSRYMPGEVMFQPADMLGSDSIGKSVALRQPVKAGYF